MIRLFHILIILSFISSNQVISQEHCGEKVKAMLIQSADVSFSQPISDLGDLKDRMESIINECGDYLQSDQNILLNYYGNLCNLTRYLGDIRNEINYLNIIIQTDDTLADSLNKRLSEIDKHYGSLRIRFADRENQLTRMASLIDNKGGNIRIDLRAPTENWDVLDKEKKRRLAFITNESNSDKLELVFDAWDTKEKYFYCEIPFIPYLEESDYLVDWYAITLDNQFRYRYNFYKIRRGEGLSPLKIVPSKEWELKPSIPNKWIKLTFENKVKPKFRDKSKPINIKTNKYPSLSPNDYITISHHQYTDYYVPTDRPIEIDLDDRKAEWWKPVIIAIPLLGIIL